MAINLLADTPKGINLLADEPKVNQQSFNDLSTEDKGKSIELARQQISQKYPGMPSWMRDAILNNIPKNESPNLEKAAQGISIVTNYVPAIAGGLAEGAATPIRAIASAIPSVQGLSKRDIPDIRTLLQKPQTGGEQAAQTTAEFVGEFGPIAKLLGVGKLAGKAANKVAPFMRGLTNDSTEQKLIEAVQKPYDALSNSADQLYGFVKDEIGKRNVSIPIKEEYLDKAKEILSNTRPNRKLIDAAKSGDYDAVHKVQSHLWQKGTKAAASGDIAKEKEGEEILDLRDMMNEDAYNHLIKTGNIDISHALKQGRDVYHTLKDTYFNKNLPKGIGKLVHPELRLVPKDLRGLFSQNSVPMQKFIEQHPDVATHIKGITEKEEAKKLLNSLMKYGAAGAAGATGVAGYDFLKQ